MAKQSLPSVDDTPPRREYVQAKEPTESVTTEQSAYNEGYVSRRVDIKLTREAALKLRDKLRQLQDAGAKTADNKFVANKTQAIQWIFENEVIV